MRTCFQYVADHVDSGEHLSVSALPRGDFEIAATVMEEAFDWLDAPVRRIGAPEMPVPYNDQLERAYLPDAEQIAAAVRDVCYAASG